MPPMLLFIKQVVLKYLNKSVELKVSIDTFLMLFMLEKEIMNTWLKVKSEVVGNKMIFLLSYYLRRRMFFMTWFMKKIELMKIPLIFILIWIVY